MTMFSLKGLYIAFLGLSSLFRTSAIDTPEDKQPLPIIRQMIQEIHNIPAYRYPKLTEFFINCESGGKITAINPYDLDGTPSFGVLQFKPSTLYMFAYVKYRLLHDIERDEIMNVIFDKDLQIQTFELMWEDPEVTFEQQFPACYKRWLKQGGKPKDR